MTETETSSFYRQITPISSEVADEISNLGLVNSIVTFEL